MNLLLDTHAVLWWLDDYESLSSETRAAITDPKNSVFLSAVVVWEIRIKESIGKLDLPDRFRAVLEAQDFMHLPVTLEHAHKVADLPMIHRDPFDRMLVAQAHCESLTIVTRDAHISEYGVRTLQA